MFNLLGRGKTDAVLLGPTRLLEFQRDGFIAIDTLVPPSEVGSIKQRLMALYERRAGFDEGAQFDALGNDDENQPMRFPQIVQPSNYDSSLTKTRFHELAAVMAREILGPRARFVGDIAMMKPAHSGAATPWHQDEAFLDPRFDYRQLNFWLALQETDQENGCMEFLPGSHKGPILRHGPPDDDNRIHVVGCIEKFDRSKIVSCPLPPGGCTIHTAQTLHGTGPNISEKARLAYVVVFDIVPLRRTVEREFPWQKRQVTARAERERAWRRKGGLLIYLWRQRSRLRFDNPRYMTQALWRATSGMFR